MSALERLDERGPALQARRKPLRLCLTGGWFSSSNIGDHAILMGVTDALSRLGACRFTVFTAAPKKVTTEYGYPAYAPRQTPFALVESLLRSDALIFTGGTPFYEAKPHMSYYTALAAIARARGIPIIVFGVSLRSLESSYCRFLMRRLATWASFLGAREQNTFDNFQSLAKDDTKVHLVPDVAIEMQPSDVARARVLIAEDGGVPTRRTIAICMRDFRTESSFQLHHYSRVYDQRALDAYHGAIRAAAIHAVQVHGCDVMFYPMHTIAPDDDRRIAKEVRDTVDDPALRERMKVVQRQHKPRDMKAILGQMHAVIGVRFHSLVLATSMRVPSVAVCYALKNQAIMEHVGQETYAIDLAQVTDLELIKLLDSVLENRDQIAKELEQRFTLVERSFSAQLDNVAQLLKPKS